MRRDRFRRAIGTAGTLAVAALIAAVAAPAAMAAPPPGLYGATGLQAPAAGSAEDRTPPSELFLLNPDTGKVITPLGDIGFPVTGLALDPTSGTLYGVTAGVEQSTADRQLIRLDSSTGAGTVVGSIGATDVVDIAFDGAGTLFGWSTSTDDLVTIDKASGAVNVVGDSGLSDTFGGGLSFDPAGRLRALVDLDYGHLWTANTGTGALTRGVELSGSPNQTGGAGMNAAAYGCGGTLYSIVNDFGAAPSHLVTIDTDRGELTTKGTNARGDTQLSLDALAWVCAGPAGAPPSPSADARCGHEVLGTAASERLVGTEAGDLITGFAGDDNIDGRGGDDCINGQEGKDVLAGGAGVDTVEGGKGADRIRGGSGRGLLRGGTGNDRLTGGSRSDVVQGNSGNDRLSGGAGDDELIGGAGDDRIVAGRGRDAIEAGRGADRISAKDGKVDVVDCGAGRDRVLSRDKRDKLIGCERR